MAQPHLLPHAATQQVVDGGIQGLADNVVEGHLDAGFGWPGSVQEAVHEPRDLVDAEGVSAYQMCGDQLGDVLALTSPLAVPNAGGFAHTGDALVGVDHNNAVLGVLVDAETAGERLRA